MRWKLTMAPTQALMSWITPRLGGELIFALEFKEYNCYFQP